MRSLLIDQALLGADPERFDALVKSSRSELVHLSFYYPGFTKWFDQKVLPGLNSGERRIVLRYLNGRLGGVSILKDTPAEKKLCCLRVLPHLSGSGLGLRMFDDAFTILGTDKPLLSVAGEQMPLFDRVFRHFGFEFTQQYRGLYRPDGLEHSFNGWLTGGVPLAITPKGDEDELCIPRDSCQIYTAR